MNDAKLKAAQSAENAIRVQGVTSEGSAETRQSDKGAETVENPVTPETRTPQAKSVLLIGTGHVFDIASAVRMIILREAPCAVCVELDRNRLAGLMQREAGTEPVPPKQPAAYRFLASMQESMAESYGTKVGGEMVAAVGAAKDLGVPLVCIDTDAEGAFRRLVRSMPFCEKARLVFGGLFSFIAGSLRRKGIEDEMAAYNKNPELYLKKIGDRYPTLKRVLIDERNERMVDNIAGVLGKFGRAVAVIGDGHVAGMKGMLCERGIEVGTVRVDDLRKMASAAGATACQNPNQSLSDDGNEAKLSFVIGLTEP